MLTFDNLAEGMLASFESKDRAREEAFRLSRNVIRVCSTSIRSVHRGDLEVAERLMDEAASGLEKIREVLSDHQDVRYAGFVDGAEQEYAEARSFYSITTRHEILAPEQIGVELVNYLVGLGDTTGELRRHILDLIRNGRAKEGEYFLGVIEEIYYLLMLFDYPDAITRGLRRKSDLARSMLEKTRGDLTNALELANVKASLQGFSGKRRD
ncbi:MAG: Translin family protein [Methanosaeta sp. PtaB.Bin018]|jgi:translin|nr:translin family protein [Methanothrix sp.]OPX75246.1 MAG: Translin family protein [Methanosaeta sp. PtaB.Bin018]HOV51611.1 translin family protein [Methanothrix sp.]